MFAGTGEGAPVPAKREKDVCRNRGRRHRSCKERKGGLQAQRKEPPFLQREKRMIAGTGEGATVPAKREKDDCRHRGRSPRSCKKRKGGLQAQGKEPPFLQKEKRRIAGA
ncbi:hypothetical protein QA612_00785 [Evansella sp. AB-P1]|uniref:hypothetical protein n=1 Tax=Evansella sp. AB-P1 TaxID=3037653 RepID=UPI00241E4F30|nr:hypothetical protein [Evansella sp. AB-P1]MDG5786005.1 hypothetical protein [Evansella sp. AB-P1]